MRILSLILLATLLPALAIAAGNGTFPDKCMHNTFPVFAGGMSNEVLRCMVYDDTSDYLIMGGKTTSSDFAPAQNDHGFIFALDGDGTARSPHATRPILPQERCP